jgi:hypothetical protein
MLLRPALAVTLISAVRPVHRAVRRCRRPRLDPSLRNKLESALPHVSYFARGAKVLSPTSESMYVDPGTASDRSRSATSRPKCNLLIGSPPPVGRRGWRFTRNLEASTRPSLGRVRLAVGNWIGTWPGGVGPRVACAVCRADSRQHQVACRGPGAGGGWSPGAADDAWVTGGGYPGQAGGPLGRIVPSGLRKMGVPSPLRRAVQPIWWIRTWWCHQQ